MGGRINWRNEELGIRKTLLRKVLENLWLEGKEELQEVEVSKDSMGDIHCIGTEVRDGISCA